MLIAQWLRVSQIIIIDMEAAWVVKIVLMGVFFLEVTVFGNCVSSLACFSNKTVMDLAMTFSGTLFLSIALIDVIPEAIQNFDEFLASSSLKYEGGMLHRGKLPLTMIIAMVTLILIMWLDKVLIGHSHDHEYEISFAAGPKRNPDGQRSVEMGQHQHARAHSDEFQGPASQHRQEENPLAQESEEDGINWKPFVLQAGMSIHAFFQTLAVGLQSSVVSVFSLAAAILVHKWAEGLTLGLLYKKQGFSRSTTVGMVILQGAMNVFGLLTGSFLMGQGSFVMAFFMSVSAGTFLYISLAEVLQEQLKQFNKFKLAMVIIANIFVAAIVWWEKAEQAQNEG